ncbi:hypothetical protein LCGC14_1142360 [marine sediment metagenome]|uniref:Flagellar basal-body/hook protein C-terminal domain-containing protein n=1 Tax=marine sediment metagenome TaxID=412755 RepID=A0A0F9PG19_9ZZZZ|nr:flagellar hook-associated protein FlgK [Methylophaga sp.]HEC59651.1 flagellar hook-associated protein FlgK [Methylophaga sp.]
MSMLNIGTSALLTSQGALTTTSHNISNVNTEGYSRQRALLGTQLATNNGNNYYGSGVQINSIERLMDSFLVDQVRTYTSQESQQATYLSFARQADDLLGSPQLGLNTGMEEFFNAVHEVANDPTSIAAREVMISQGEVLAKRFNVLDQQMKNFDSQVDDAIAGGVSDINVIAQGIADLNRAIVTNTSSSGGAPNDLLDQRDKLINDLSKYVSISTVKEDSGSLNVFIGTGQAIVTGVGAIKLSVIPDNSSSPPRSKVGYGPGGIDISAQLTGGTIGGAFQVRTEVIDPARAELNQLAFSMADAFNTQNLAGVDLDGNAATSPANLFFGDLSAVPPDQYASAIKVVMTDPKKIAASSSTSAAVGNNENILKLADLQTVKTMAGGTQTFASSYGVLVAKVATKTHQADIGQQTQQGLLNQVKLKADSVAGVNLDEEAANLIKYQQAYQAASQIITVSNTVFNSLINAF